MQKKYKKYTTEKHMHGNFNTSKINVKHKCEIFLKYNKSDFSEYILQFNIEITSVRTFCKTKKSNTIMLC